VTSFTRKARQGRLEALTFLRRKQATSAKCTLRQDAAATTAHRAEIDFFAAKFKGAA